MPVDLIDLDLDSEGEWYDNGEYFQEVMAGIINQQAINK